MNNKKRIVDLDLGDVVKQVFYIKEAEFRLRRDGKTVDGFLRISDSSGEIEAIYWDISDKELSQIENMQFAQIAGQVIKKKSDGQIQMSIKSLESAPESSLEDFIPATPLNVEELMQEIDHKISSIKHQYLKALLLSFFDDLILRGKFKKTPAAKKLHQAYKGGLAEHTVNVSRICETICQIYPQVNRDFLVVLHFFMILER